MNPGRARTLRAGRFSVLVRPRTMAVCTILTVIGLMLALLLLGTGTVRLSPAQVLAGLSGSSDDAVVTRVLQRIRLPRLLTAAMVGASLSMAGAVFQTLSRNALGSPDIIGFTTGAATGAILQIILFNAGALQVAVAAILAGLVTACVVLLLSRRDGQGGGYRLILVGIGIGAVLTGANNMIMVAGDLDRAMSAQIWLAGSLNARSWSHVWPALAGLVLFAPIVVLNIRRLQVLEMGEDTARQLGVRVGPTRMVVVLAAVGLTSVATASAGPVAFVALAGPQIARRLTRSPDLPLVSGALTGAVLLLIADLVSQRAPFDLMLPIGVMTGFGGGLYLIWLLIVADPTGGRK